MYNNSSHYPSGYPNAYQQYPTGYDAAAYNYQGYTQYQNQSAQPIPPGENTYPQSESNWSTSGYGSTPKDAVAQEMQQQKAQLVKQREDYVRKVSVLRRELDQLRMQKQDLLGDERGSKRDLANILKENDKLQDEIQGKMKAIQNVIEMLSSIIKDGQSIADLEAALAEKEHSRSSPGQSQSQSNDRYQSPNDRYNYVHYDTGLHWCRLCDEFPDTAKDFLMHLQEKGHRESAKENDVDNTPWHKLPAEATLESYEDAPVKRVPIKGLQFFISAPSWYCKLCDVWIGDLHCASHHLKSKVHYQNYENFVSQNPHWEVEWLKDRDKAMERKGAMNSSDDSDHRRSSRKRRKDKADSKDKKKKRRSKKRRRKSSDSSSSSSSSDSSSDDDKTDRSKSIRVTMRNVKSIMDEDLSGKWSVLEKLVEEHKKKQEEVEKVEREKKEKGTAADPLINQWMTVSHGQEKDKVLFNSLKDRMKQKQEQEKAKQMEVDKKKREKEQEEAERLKKREKEEREAAEEREREVKRREDEEMNRIRDKERNQLKFKTSYRKRNSVSRSDDEEREKYFREEREKEQRERYRRDSGRDRSSGRSSRDAQSRSPSTDRKNGDGDKKKSYKRLPFIGRMPLFKNRKAPEEKEEKKKEIQKESYEPQRRTRFEPGNLPRAFIPRPDVVCFPRLSSIPPLTMPPPEKVEAPEPPTISEALQREVDKEEAEDEVAMEEDEEEDEPEPPLQAPPPPKIDAQQNDELNLSDDEVLYGNSGEDMGQYYQGYSNALYSQDMYYQGESVPPPPPNMPRSHTLPLEPPPLPPDDDLAMLGICADDMAAQSF